ncbi:hypothetical protein SOVF_079300, partial [Spinacia oleracea]
RDVMREQSRDDDGEEGRRWVSVRESGVWLWGDVVVQGTREAGAGIGLAMKMSKSCA